MRCKDCGAKRKTVSRPGPRCATCKRAKSKADRARAHDNQVQKLYGLRPGEYQDMYASQGGTCALCQRATGKRKRLAVDHDHRTGCVRGLLCGPCNKLLGHARDDPEYFERCVIYLSRSANPQVGVQ